MGEEGVEICARGKGIKRINDYYHMKGGDERRRRLYKGRREAGKVGEVAAGSREVEEREEIEGDNRPVLGGQTSGRQAAHEK